MDEVLYEGTLPDVELVEKTCDKGHKVNVDIRVVESKEFKCPICLMDNNEIHGDTIIMSKDKI